MKQAQVAIEYVFLLVFSLVFFLVLSIGIATIAQSKQDQKAYVELVDFTKSLQQEFMLAAQVQDGYQRTIVLPPTFAGRNYSVVLVNGTSTYSLLEMNFDNYQVYYRIPLTTGVLGPGTQSLLKRNGTLVIE